MWGHRISPDASYTVTTTAVAGMVATGRLAAHIEQAGTLFEIVR
jgi:hypothetical protein